MKISAQLATIFSAIFATICLGFAISGFLSLGEIADATQRDDAQGFARFWSFLAGVALFFGVASWSIRNKGSQGQ